MNNSTHFSIRLMRQEDAIQMAEISLEAFPTMQPPTNYQREYRNPLAHYIVVHDLAANREVFGVKLTRYMVGYAGFWLMADEAHIVDIAVRETYRRQGLGELLLINLLALVITLNSTQATLEVRISNQPAICLYQKFGFISQGTRRRYYTDNNEDAVIMTAADIKSADFMERFNKLRRSHAEKWGFRLYPLPR